MPLSQESVENIDFLMDRCETAEVKPGKIFLTPTREVESVVGSYMEQIKTFSSQYNPECGQTHTDSSHAREFSL